MKATERNNDVKPETPEDDGFFVLLLRFYRRFLSPLKKPCCRFTPTCSAYAIGAIREWGVIFGLSLSLWRILRCNPFSAGGNDPVPENPFLKKNRSSKDRENR